MSHALLMPAAAEPCHTHEWKVRVAVAAETLDEMALAADFVEISRHIADITGPLQNAELEASCASRQKRQAPSVSRSAHRSKWPHACRPPRLEYVEIMEAPGCWVRYRP